VVSTAESFSCRLRDRASATHHTTEGCAPILPLLFRVHKGTFTQGYLSARLDPISFPRPPEPCHPLSIPCQDPSLVRGEMARGTGWVFEPIKGAEDVTRVTYTIHMDPKGTCQPHSLAAPCTGE
jgi:hypothetical protein